MFVSMLRRLWRRPFSLAIVAVLVGVPIAGGAAMLVSEEFRQEVEARVAGTLPGTAVGGCEIKPKTQCPNANLSGANLSWARLVSADLTEANLSQANLYWANLSGANLSGADGTKANVTAARFCNTTMPDGSLNNSGCQ